MSRIHFDEVKVVILATNCVEEPYVALIASGNSKWMCMFGVPDGGQKAFSSERIDFRALKGVLFHTPTCRTASGLVPLVAAHGRYGVKAPLKLVTQSTEARKDLFVPSMEQTHYPVKVSFDTFPCICDGTTISIVGDKIFLCYKVESPREPDVFNKPEADRLKVPLNELRYKLIKGESITVEDGRVVEPKDVMVPGHLPPTIYMFIHRQDIDRYVDDILGFAGLRPQYFRGGEHWLFLDSNLYVDARIKQWLSEIVTENKNARIIVLDRQGFLLYSRTNKTSRDATALKLITNKKAQWSGYVGCFTPLKIDTRNTVVFAKRTFIETTKMPLDNVPSYISDGAYFSYMAAAMKPAMRDTHELPDVKTFTPSAKELKGEEEFYFPHFVLLGTGATSSLEKRNSSSCLVRVNEVESFLVDCGESTLGQIYKKYGDGFHHVLKSIKAIFLTHEHVDHVSGLLQFTEFWMGMNNGQNLQVYYGGNKLTQTYIKFINSSLGQVLVPVEVGIKMYGNKEPYTNYIAVPSESVLVRSFVMVHSELSVGYLFNIQTKTGRDFFVFSGDGHKGRELPLCVNHERELYPNSNVILTHDSTFEDSLQDHASCTSHSIVSDAFEVGLSCDADCVIFTHHTQRKLVSGNLANITRMDEFKARYGADKCKKLQCCTAQDMMTINLGLAREYSKVSDKCVNLLEWLLTVDI